MGDREDECRILHCGAPGGRALMNGRLACFLLLSSRADTLCESVHEEVDQ
jgi:hypothetical protein